MRNLIFPLTITTIIAFGCTNEKSSSTTILGDGTPYSNYPEIMNEKVKTVVEKNFWAIQDGNSLKKGNPLTKADRDSIGGWTDDFEAVYDENGVIIECTGLDETGKSIWKNESIVENKLVVKRNIYRNDTLRIYDQFKYDEQGFLTKGTRYRSGIDTLMISVDIKVNAAGYPVEFQLFNSDNEPIEKYIHTYDELNRFTKLEVFDKNGIINYKHEVKYNDKGKVSDLIITDKDNNITASNYFTYEYDEKGNWVKAIVKDDKNHVVIEERSYTYFE